MPESFDPEITAMLRELLRQCAEAGVRVEVSVEPDACATCGRQGGKSFDPTAAPPLPIGDCANEICRCDYSPLV